jgi:OmpA-OmpF porin, OOP family
MDYLPPIAKLRQIKNHEQQRGRAEMNSNIKILLGALLSAFIGWAMFSNNCPATGGALAEAAPAKGTSVSPATTQIPAATAEAVAECQGDINTVMTGKTVNFQSGSAYLAGDGNSLLDDVATALKPCAGNNVEIQGHTDLIGGAAINQTLSQSRADTVKAALVTRGIAAERLTAKGYGASQPLENARTAAANAKNRRTIFVISAANAAPQGGQ